MLCAHTTIFTRENAFHIVCPGAFSRPSRYRCHFRLSKISTQPTDDKRRKFTCAQQRREEKKFSSRLRSFAFDNFPGGGFFFSSFAAPPSFIKAFDVASLTHSPGRIMLKLNIYLVGIIMSPVRVEHVITTLTCRLDYDDNDDGDDFLLLDRRKMKMRENLIGRRKCHE